MNHEVSYPQSQQQLKINELEILHVRCHRTFSNMHISAAVSGNMSIVSLHSEYVCNDAIRGKRNTGGFKTEFILQMYFHRLLLMLSNCWHIHRWHIYKITGLIW